MQLTIKPLTKTMNPRKQNSLLKFKNANMKNTLKTFAVVAASTILLNSNVSAQRAASGPAIDVASIKTLIALNNSGDEKKSMSTTNAHPRAIEFLQKKFKGVNDAVWYKNNGCYFASFVYDSVQTRVDYNKNGRWMETLRYYSENMLPENITDMVKETYRKYSIAGVTEISFDYGEPVYLLHLQGDNQIKMVGVYREEMIEVM